MPDDLMNRAVARLSRSWRRVSLVEGGCVWLLLLVAPALAAQAEPPQAPPSETVAGVQQSLTKLRPPWRRDDSAGRSRPEGSRAVTSATPLSISSGPEQGPREAESSSHVAPWSSSQAEAARLAAPLGARDSRALSTVIASLAGMLGVFLILIWVTRRRMGRGWTPLPNVVVESLGRMPLANRQQMQLIRVGNKLVLLGITPTGAAPLTEVTDPQEVDRLAGLCQANQAGSVTASFRQILRQASQEPASGLVGWTSDRSRPLPRTAS